MPDNKDINAYIPENFENAVGYSSADVLFDVEDYREDFQDIDLTEKQLTELLQSLWYIIKAIIEAEVGIDPIQMLFTSARENTSPDSGNRLDSKNAQLLDDKTADSAGKGCS